MSGPKRWRVHRKGSSKSSLGSTHSASPLDDRPPPSPPCHLHPLPLEETTNATAALDYGSGSTLATQKSGVDGLRDGLAAGGGPPTVYSHSSIDSMSSNLTQSPSTTPPKKAWEKNYKSFLKRSGKHSKAPGNSSPVARIHHVAPFRPSFHSHSRDKSDRPVRSSSEGSADIGLLFKANHQSLFLSPHEDFGPSLADGFEDHTKSSTGSASTRSKGHPSTIPNRSMSNHSIVAPPSPTKAKEIGSRSGAFFKRMRGKTKSVENLDSSMRRGIDRKSPTNTPPGSAASTPVYKRSPMTASPGGHAAGSAGGGGTAHPERAQESLHKAAMRDGLLFPPSLTSNSSGSRGGTHKLGLLPVPRLASQGNLTNDKEDLDQVRHRGHSLSIGPPPTTLSSTPTTQAFFSRVQSMGSNLIIPEGKPVTAGQVEGEERALRERRKAFTDFHNMGVDSSSAYLGDETSLHRDTAFLSSMAYPAGSAGGKVHNNHTYIPSGPHSFDPKQVDSETKSRRHSASVGDFSADRALRPLVDPATWTKEERHAILPAILCMCPIQVLHKIMSEDDGSLCRPSFTSRETQRGFGIGSVISEDDGADSSGWFFADQHQPRTAAGTPMPPRPSNMSGNELPSAFGKVFLGKATVAPLGMRTFLNEIYGWCTGVFVLRLNYLFEYREGDSLSGLPWGYAHLPLAEAYPHKHFTNALHLDFFEKPCCKSGKRSLLLRVESKGERDRWVSLLQSAARMTLHDLYSVDESDGSPEFGHGQYAVVRPAKRKDHRKVLSFSDTRYLHTSSISHESFRNASSLGNLSGCNKSSNTDLEGESSEHTCALKIIDKTEFWRRVKRGRERADTLVREAAIQTTLAVQAADTPGFLRLHNIFETGDKLVLELELLKGTDLFQHVSSRGVLNEVEAAQIMRDMLTCLKALDDVGVAHRDIKPANLLMCHEESNGGTKIKLADYGMASFVGIDNLVRGRCGTPGFVAPEILLTGVNGGYGNKVDMFSAGVVLYVMLAGYEPFYGESDAELIDANREAKLDFPHADWHSVSVEGRDLIERMLVVDPSKRIGPSEALRHPWITRRATQNAE